MFWRSNEIVKGLRDSRICHLFLLWIPDYRKTHLRDIRFHFYEYFWRVHTAPPQTAHSFHSPAITMALEKVASAFVAAGPLELVGVWKRTGLPFRHNENAWVFIGMSLSEGVWRKRSVVMFFFQVFILTTYLRTSEWSVKGMGSHLQSIWK